MEKSILGTFFNKKLTLLGDCNYQLTGHELSGGKCILDLKEFGPLFQVIGAQSSLNVENFKVINGKSIGWGGVFVVSGGATAHFSNVLFESNSGGNGGAVAAFTMSTVTYALVLPSLLKTRILQTHA